MRRYTVTVANHLLEDAECVDVHADTRAEARQKAKVVVLPEDLTDAEHDAWFDALEAVDVDDHGLV